MTILDYAIVIVYLAGMILVGLYFERKASGNIDSYFLGKRGLPWWALGASGMSSNLDVSGTMINTAFIFALGASGFFIEIRGGVTLIMAFLMIFQGKWNRRALVMTLAEWMHFRFGKDRQGDVARLIAAFSIIVVTIAMITYFAIGSGKFVGEFLGIGDVGLVTDKLEQNEIINVEKQLAELTAATGLSERLIESPELERLGRRLTVTRNEINQAWTHLKANAGDVTALSGFTTNLTKNMTVIDFIEKKLDAVTVENEAFIRAELEQVKAAVGNAGSIFNESVSYYMLTSQFLAALLMIFLAMIYTVASGLYGVVWTDVFQGVLIFGTIFFICGLAFFNFNLPDIFHVSVPLRDGGFMPVQTTKEAWTSMIPQWSLDLPAESTYSIYNLFGIAILFYLIKVTIEGSGGTSQYMIQRFFASRSDRESGLLSMFWIFLLAFRWPFIAAIAIMGIVLGAQQTVIQDPETVLPVVINQLVPIGVKGLLIAGLMAAAMSTFDSTVNAGAAYWVKDIYQTYINPKASEKQLLRHSRWSSVIIVALGLLFTLAVRNINEIWGWITSSLGAGLLIPTLARWYWWRMNGYGFAFGTIAGMVAAVVQRMFLPDIPEYSAFIITTVSSLAGMIAGTYSAKPTDDAVLFEFYKRTRPFGFWGPVKKKLSAEVKSNIDKENRRDIISTFLAVPWQLVLFLCGMAIIFKSWDQFFWLLIIFAALSLGLYFKWFRHLSTEVKVD